MGMYIEKPWHQPLALGINNIAYQCFIYRFTAGDNPPAGNSHVFNNRCLTIVKYFGVFNQGVNFCNWRVHYCYCPVLLWSLLNQVMAQSVAHADVDVKFRSRPL